MSEKPEYDWGFAFPHGFKWSCEMSREELLAVISHFRAENDKLKVELRAAWACSREIGIL